MSATPGKAARMIRAARAAQHESQGQLAERMTAATGETWTRDHIAAIENGRKKVEADDIPAFAMVQGTQLGWYFDAQIGDVPDHSVPATLPTASPNPGSLNELRYPHRGRDGEALPAVNPVDGEAA